MKTLPISFGTHRKRDFIPDRSHLFSSTIYVGISVLLLGAFLGFHSSRYLFILLIAIPGALLLARHLHFGLIFLPVVALLVPFEIGTGTDVVLNAAVLIVPLLATLWLMRMFLRRNVQFVSSRLNRPLLALSAVILFSLLRGNVMWDISVPRPANAGLVQMAQVTIYFLSFIAFWLTANQIADLKWLRRVTYGIVIFGCVAVLTIVFSRTILHTALRFELAMMHNIFTVWLVGLSLALAFYDRDLRKWQRSALIGTAVSTIMSSLLVWFFGGDWIGGWAPPLIAAAVVIWVRYPRLRILSIGLIGLLLVVSAPALLFDIARWQQKWSVSGGSRLALWRSILELVAQSPVFGLGIVAYRYYHFLKPLAYGNALWLNPTVAAHNMFVDMFAQLGLIGVLCYAWFLTEAMRLARRLFSRSSGFARAYALAASAALCGILVADMLAATSLPFVYNLGFRGFRSSVISWMLLGGLVVLENLQVNENLKSTSTENFVSHL